MTRTTRGKPPDRYGFQARYATEDYKEPRNRDEALDAADREKWIKAMNEEIKSINENYTWVLTELLKDKNAIGCKWIYKRKKNTIMGITKYKARLVAQGFSQKYGIDYDEMFAPVVRATILRLLLTIATQRVL